MSNIVNVNVKYQQGRTEPLFQYDYGQILKINGIELPLAYEVHFADSPNSATSITKIGNEDGVEIPDEILYKSGAAYAWLFLHTGENDGETRVVITIPVIARAKITDPAVTPAQEDVITQTLAALNTAAETCADYALSCEDAVEECMNCIEYYPEIGDNGNWFVYDAVAGEMVDTGINAKGYQGDPGPEGPTGPAPNMTLTATADAVSSANPTVTVTKSGTNTEPIYSMAFSGLKGTQGVQGEPGESSSVWYSDVAPTNYAGVGVIFYKTNLHGQESNQRVNELVFFGSKYWTISDVRETYVIVTNETSIKGQDGTPGSHIWESTVAPVSPDYTFYVEDLEGPDVDIEEGDLIFYGDYYYSIDSFNQDAALCTRWVKITPDPDIIVIPCDFASWLTTEEVVPEQNAPLQTQSGIYHAILDGKIIYFKVPTNIAKTEWLVFELEKYGVLNSMSYTFKSISQNENTLYYKTISGNGANIDRFDSQIITKTITFDS